MGGDQVLVHLCFSPGVILKWPAGGVGTVREREGGWRRGCGCGMRERLFIPGPGRQEWLESVGSLAWVLSWASSLVPKSCRFDSQRQAPSPVEGVLEAAD